MTDGQHLSDQNSEIDALETKEAPLGKLYAALGIIALLIGAIFWVANVSSTASQGLQMSQQNSAKLEQKADKTDTQEIKQDIKEFRKEFEDFLRDDKRRN